MGCVARVGAISERAVCAARVAGALWGSEGFATGEHVPDGTGLTVRAMSILGDLGAALAAETPFRGLVAVAIGRVPTGMGRGFEHCPAQVFRSVLGERAAPIVVTGG